MLKKRLIFTLLYNDGYFVLSRNFKLQRIGDLNWLIQNYHFLNISSVIDELVILNVSRNDSQKLQFLDMLNELTRNCFIPIAAGGWVRDCQDAANLLSSGADKVVVNSILFSSPSFVEELSENFGAQCVVASVDVTMDRSFEFRVRTHRGSEKLLDNASDLISRLNDMPVGDLYLNSIDRDGTGQGYFLEMLDLLPKAMKIPVILAGGAGNVDHLRQGLIDRRVDAVATAHLLNFVGDGLLRARQDLRANGIELPERPPNLDRYYLSL